MKPETDIGGLGVYSMAVMVIGWVTLALLIRVGLRNDHAPARFGAANVVTSVRAVLAVLLAGLAVESGLPTGPFTGAHATVWVWAVTLIAIGALALDGIDGPLARATGSVSRFGARFDMETDALLALVLSVFVWRSGELGAWVLALGTMRYLFVAAACWLPALRADLYPSFRRKLVCVIQIACLCAIVSPLVEGSLSVVLGTLATLALGTSFARDVHWLLTRAPVTV